MDIPQFPKLDPAGAEFWDVRYREAFTPWDAGRVPARLKEFVAAEGAPGRVLVPGCGSAHDVRFLAESGWEVEGFDFSAAAIEAAAPVLGPYKDKVVLADFFGPTVAGPFALVYERAFLCALPRRRWPEWAERVANLLPVGARLAGCFYYDDATKPGPPYPLRHRAELHTLLDAGFEQVVDLPIDDSIEVFAGKERWEVWRRR